MFELKTTTDNEISELGNLLDEVFRRSKGITNQSQLTDFPLVYCPANYRNSRIIVEDGKIVSHAAYWPRTLVIGESQLKAATIVSVATDADYRLRGHAARLMRDLHEALEREEFDIAILWTSSPDFYIKLGWEVVTTKGLIATIDETVCLGNYSKTSLYTVVEFDAASHLDEINSIHNSKSVHMTRTASEALKLLTLPKTTTWVATSGQSIAAYLVHATACNKRGIIEYGGNVDAIATLVEHVAKTTNTPQEWKLFPECDGLIGLAKSCGLPCRPLPSSKGAGTEMIYAVNPETVAQVDLSNLFVWGLDWA